MNQSSLADPDHQVGSTATLNDAPSSAPVLSEQIKNHPFVALAQRLGITGLNDRLYRIAIAICDCSGGSCPLKDIIEFRSIKSDPAMKTTVIIQENGEEVPLILTMKRDSSDRDLKHETEVVLYWDQIVILIENQADFVLAARGF